MMTLDQAKQALKKFNPKLNVIQIEQYDSQRYVAIAYKPGEGLDAIDPYYAINMKTGKVTEFTPASDLDHFFEVFKMEEDDDDEYIEYAINFLSGYFG